MNFLTLVQYVWRESGSGGTPPGSLENDLKGEHERLRVWVQQADLEINSLYSDWEYLWAQHPMELQAGQAIYSPLSTTGNQVSPSSQIAAYDRNTFFLTDPENSDKNPVQIGAPYYLQVKRDRTVRPDGEPFRVVILPDRTLRFDPAPDKAYTVTFDYWATPNVMVRNDDEPAMPSRYHWAIVGRALQLYAEYENADETMAKGTDLYERWLDALEANQLPGHRDAHTRAEGSINLDQYVE